MNKKAFQGLFWAILVAAFIFRAAGLELRPMHHDEANQAVKFGDLLEEGIYRYDPADHHGPSLYYLSLPFALVVSGKDFSLVDETTLRLGVVFFGVGLLMLLLLLEGEIGRRAVLIAALFAAFSPVMTYYSRFYIQETLLVFFLMGFLMSVWAASVRPLAGRALAAGIFAGLMYATKETSVIAFGAIAVALLGSRMLTKKRVALGLRKTKLFSYWLLAAAAAIGVAFLFYTSFLVNPEGLKDSILSFKTYFTRAGEPGWHFHPWSEYLKMLAFSRYGDGPVWSEGFVLFLAVVGGFASIKRMREMTSETSFPLFILLYTITSTTAYSLISYKTPWNLLPFYLGFILLAGIGASFLFEKAQKFLSRAALILVLGLGFVHLGFQNYRANFVDYADSRNPYVYAQTSKDFLGLIRRIESVARSHPDRKKMLVKVIAGPYETWPLPWYLRGFEKVGYWQDVDEAGTMAEASLVVCSIDQEEKIVPQLEDNFLSEYYELRPGSLLCLSIRRDLWNEFMSEQEKR